MTDSGRTTAFIAGLVIFAGGAAALAQERGAEPGRRVVIEQAPLGLRMSTGLNGAVDPLAGPPVSGAPFSGEASTTVTQTLGDGTHIEQRTLAKLYRDSTGRVRREQTIIGLDRLNPATQSQTVISFDSVPGDPMPYILDPEARVATRTNRVGGFYVASGQLTALRFSLAGSPENRELERASNLLASGGLTVSATAAAVPADIRPTEEDLGTRQMDGVKVTGRRTTTVFPTGRIGNDSPTSGGNRRSWASPCIHASPTRERASSNTA